MSDNAVSPLSAQIMPSSAGSWQPKDLNLNSANFEQEFSILYTKRPTHSLFSTQIKYEETDMKHGIQITTV